MNKESDQRILFFDGLCNLCNSSVDFVMRHDKKGRIKFASLQSDIAKKMLPPELTDEEKLSSLVFIKDETIYSESSAALRVAGEMGGLISFLKVFLIVPPVIRDGVYCWVAKNRFKWFGKKESCRLPTEAEAERFL